ncbi:MAG: serine/threonine-protein phosphatase [Pseudomonadales bacterium]|nr:serine/threonine-protein phosphatase [Pseudomonadales bacterium]
MTLNYTWRSCAETHRGAVRKVNEDSVLDRPEVGLWTVADGMGGHEAGDVASQMLVRTLSGTTQHLKLSQFVNQAEDLIHSVHDNILERSESEYGGRTMGCTVVTLLVHENVGVCLWAGDSRLYRKRRGHLQMISSDHSQVNEMVGRGLISEEEAENHPASNVITRAVGATPDLHLDATVFDIKRGDTFLLCSDGLYGELGMSEIDAYLRGDEVDRVAGELIQAALKRGAKDNVSVIVVKAL